VLKIRHYAKPQNVIRQCKNQPNGQAHLFFPNASPGAKKQKSLPFPPYELNNVENFQNKTGELKQKLLNLPKLSR
jgi:hypothetical protein